MLSQDLVLTCTGNFSVLWKYVYHICIFFSEAKWKFLSTFLIYFFNLELYYIEKAIKEIGY